MTKTIRLPHNFKYREYQKWIRDYIRNWWKRAVVVWHRRAGKDKTYFNILVEQAITNVWSYIYVLPTYAQWKRIIWDSIDKRTGYRFIDHIPKEILESTNSTELKFNLKNGSFIQIVWSDNIDALRWISPAWIVFSEYAFQNPQVWDVLTPILRENGGWAIFNSTPNWKNHFYDLYNMAKENPDWFCEKLTLEDTKAYDQSVIEEDRQNGMSEELIQQEYFCSFDVWIIWSYYASLIEKAKDEWRITKLPVASYTKTDIFIDIWVNDSFAIWIKQNEWQYYNFIKYFEDNWKQLDYYFNFIEDFLSDHALSLWYIYIPHDWNNKAHSYLVSGITILDKFKQYFWADKVKLIERPKSVNDWIEDVRKILNRCRFDEEETKQGIRCLENYKKKYDNVKKVFSDKPDHDWASHWADAFRYFAIVENKNIEKKNTIKKNIKPFNVVFEDYL